MAKVKKVRAYDGRSRTEQAQNARERVLEAARSAFLANGYGATTIRAIAEAAGVSVETVYKSFGGKSGLVRAIHLRGLEGRGPVPAETRSDATSASEEDPHALVEKWGRFITEVSPLVSPILLLVRAAAATEPELASLLREIDDARLERMTKNAGVLARRGFLRDGLSVERAGEILWAYTAPELYDLFVMRRGWSPEAYGAYVADTLKGTLLRR